MPIHLSELLTPEEYAEHQRLATKALALREQMERLGRRATPSTLQQTSRRMGISTERVRQIEKLALHKLRHNAELKKINSQH